MIIVSTVLLCLHPCCLKTLHPPSPLSLRKPFLRKYDTNKDASLTFVGAPRCNIPTISQIFFRDPFVNFSIDNPRKLTWNRMKNEGLELLQMIFRNARNSTPSSSKFSRFAITKGFLRDNPRSTYDMKGSVFDSTTVDGRTPA